MEHDDFRMDELDLAVADALGWTQTTSLQWRNALGFNEIDGRRFSPTRNWADAGPLVERFNLQLQPMNGAPNDQWLAWPFPSANSVRRGETPLIAICRAVLAVGGE